MSAVYNKRSPFFNLRQESVLGFLLLEVTSFQTSCSRGGVSIVPLIMTVGRTGLFLAFCLSLICLAADLFLVMMFFLSFLRFPMGALDGPDTMFAYVLLLGALLLSLAGSALIDIVVLSFLVETFTPLFVEPVFILSLLIVRLVTFRSAFSSTRLAKTLALESATLPVSA